MTTKWTRRHLLDLDDTGRHTGVFSAEECQRVLPDLYLWDLWPVRHRDGSVASLDGDELWMALSASSTLQPGQRHDVARIRLLTRGRRVWRDHGGLFPESSSPGSREWAGCAVYDRAGGRLDVFYTATGARGENRPTFRQRIVGVSGRLHRNDDLVVSDWGPHRDMVVPSDRYRSTEHQDTGEPGFIKAFRDPFFFQDPGNGSRFLLFTASLADSTTEFDGAIGVAVGDPDSGFTLLPPLITADGVNNELERPHVVVRDGHYYLFFSTQARTFHTEVSGPTGLYGFVAGSLEGPWTPLNGSGLVLTNPPEEPFQAYSWLVLNDLSVVSFVDFHGLGGKRPEEVEEAGAGRDHFGGTLARVERIAVNGATTRLL